MASFAHLEERNFNTGLLPPLRELFLEVQVNKLIKEYLFSSNADEMCVPPRDGLSEYKENKAPDRFYAADTALQSACNAPCLKPTEASHDCHNQSQGDRHHMQTAQASLTLHSIACIQENGMNGKDQTATTTQAGNGTPEASMATLFVESEGKLMHQTSHLSRADTFPCANKLQLQVGMTSKANTEIKASCKKPPRPPRLPKSELSSSLTRCFSDNSAYLQSCRRSKLEKKRKATALSSVNTSIYALMFTFCFAIIMIAQGFWSQGSQNLTIYGGDASSPVETFVKASAKGSLDEPSLASVVDGQASTEDVLAQSYVMRKVLSQYLSDMKHLELDTFSKS